jgi:hypothetical protein
MFHYCHFSLLGKIVFVFADSCFFCLVARPGHTVSSFQSGTLKIARAPQDFWPIDCYKSCFGQPHDSLIRRLKFEGKWWEGVLRPADAVQLLRTYFTTHFDYLYASFFKPA